MEGPVADPPLPEEANGIRRKSCADSIGLLPALCGPVSHDREVAAADKSGGIASTTIDASDNELIASSLTFVFNQTGQLIEIKE